MQSSPASIKWVTTVRLIRANRTIVAATNEPFLVRDYALLESAVNAPINLHNYEEESDLIRLAVRLLRSVGKNHPFEQGNKRTAFNGAVAFLALNGVRFAGPDDAEVARYVIQLVTGEMDESELIAFLRPYCIVQT